jgi:hypothetical protein
VNAPEIARLDPPPNRDTEEAASPTSATRQLDAEVEVGELGLRKAKNARAPSRVGEMVTSLPGAPRMTTSRP